MQFVGDLVEADGKTWKENNLDLKHLIPLGTLVEIVDKEEDSCIKRFLGVRMFVAFHGRDCDGSPLYSLTHDRTMCDDELANRGLSKDLLEMYRRSFHQGSFGEESLEVVAK